MNGIWVDDEAVADGLNYQFLLDRLDEMLLRLGFDA